MTTTEHHWLTARGKRRNAQGKLIEQVIQLASGNGFHSHNDLLRMCGSGASKDLFLRLAEMLPWATTERSAAGVHLIIDHYLKAVCEGRAPRPALAGASITSALEKLGKEIHRKRKENHEFDSTRNWGLSRTRISDQKILLNWIEEELAKLLNAAQPDPRPESVLTDPDADQGKKNVIQKSAGKGRASHAETGTDDNQHARTPRRKTAETEPVEISV
jgi:hypothetical protein